MLSNLSTTAIDVIDVMLSVLSGETIDSIRLSPTAIDAFAYSVDSIVPRVSITTVHTIAKPRPSRTLSDVPRFPPPPLLTKRIVGL